MFFRSLPPFSWSNQVENQEQENFKYQNFQKMTWISGVAIASIAFTAWNIVERRPWMAATVAVGGICLEMALICLFPSKAETIEEKDLEETDPIDTFPVDSSPVAAKSPALDSQILSPVATKMCETVEGLEILIENLEAAYPIQAMNSMRIKDKQIGGMMGQACGDAIGLFTEFTTRDEAQEMMAGHPIELGPDYPEKFQNGYNWGHINRFIKNGWTDDTDQALSLLRALYLQMNQKEDETLCSFELLFARELKKWRCYGLRTEDSFIGRSDPYCMGLGALVESVLRKSSFLKHAKQTAEDVWGKKRDIPLQNRPAANGAIMRTAPIGLIFYRSLNDVIFYTIEACKVTHADPRCIASCIAFNVAIALSLRGYDCDTLFKAAEEVGLASLRYELDLVAEKELLSEEETKDLDTLYEKLAEDFKAHLHGDWDSLDLDEGYKDSKKMNKIGYTFKCLGAAFYALRLASQEEEKDDNLFRTIIEMIAAEGGDADTNGAAAGALLGAYLGFKDRFPQNWTSQLADAPVLEQAIQHVEELSLKHENHLKVLGKKSMA